MDEVPYNDDDVRKFTRQLWYESCANKSTEATDDNYEAWLGEAIDLYASGVAKVDAQDNRPYFERATVAANIAQAIATRLPRLPDHYDG